MCGRVPGLPPVPWQVAHAASEVSRSEIVTPSRASTNPIVAVVSTSPPRRGRGWRVARPAALVEDVAEHVAEAAGAAARPVAQQVVDVEAAAAEAAAGLTGAAAEAAEPAAGLEPAELVVLGALVGVTDDVVGLGDGLEPVVLGGVAGVGVGVVGPRELAVGLLDVVGGRVLGHAEHG